MAGYKTRSSWSAPDIQFDAAGKRIRPGSGPAPEPERKCSVCRLPVSECYTRLGMRRRP